jgi:formiminotetrahydrofolate cyclodeaminase
VESLDAYLDKLASRDAVPGGGSAAALTGALAAALVAMVGRILPEPSDALVSEADGLRAALDEARDRDERAYAAVVAAQALPKRNESEIARRREALAATLADAARAPLGAAGLALAVLKLADSLAQLPRSALSSDVGCAAELAFAAVAACAYNVRVNHRYMHDAELVHEQAVTLAGYEEEARTLLARVRKRLAL